MFAGAVLGTAGMWWWQTMNPAIHPGVLLTVGPSAKTDPYAVAQGAVTHGEPVLVDFGDGEVVFFVNRSEDVVALVNGCDERASPAFQRRQPVLVEARFHTRPVPPYLIETASTVYRFEAAVAPSSSCATTTRR